MNKKAQTHEGGCTCGHVRYRLNSDPMIVHGCHCRWCQRQSGSAYAINALIEADRVEILKGDVDCIETDTPTGSGQTIARCPKCKIAVWSNYDIFMPGDDVRFIRVGSLDNPDLLPPDVHIYTSTKQPWIILPPNDPVDEEFYDFDTTWTEEGKKRRAAVEKVAEARKLEIVTE